MTIEDFYWQSAVGDHWAQYVEAAGCAEPDQEIGDIFLLAGLIQQDPVVATRFAERIRNWRPSEAEKVAPSHKFYVEVLLTMTVEEKRALKRRVLDGLGRSRGFMEARNTAMTVRSKF